MFGELNATAVVVAALQTTWLDTTATVAFGRTVMVNVRGVPVQATLPLVNVGVTVMVATSGDVIAFVAVNAVISPVPEEARPIFVLVLVQS